MKWDREAVFLLSVFAPLVLGSVPAGTDGASAGGTETIASPAVAAQQSTDRSITGVVTDEGAAPLAGVTVTAHCHITSLGSDRYRWVFSDQLNVPAATTNADGRFRIEGLEDGWYCLLVSPPNHAARIVYDVPAGTKDMTIEVHKGATIAGRVVQIQDGRKMPIPNVAVKATSHAWDPYLDLGARKELETTTDSDGRFQLENLSPDQRDIHSVTIGHEIRRPRTWRISAGERSESITFDQDGESRFLEFILAREVHILLNIRVLEIKHNFEVNRQAIAQIHGFLVQAASKDANDDAIKRIPSVADLTNKPRTVLARYLQSGQLHPGVVKPFADLLQTLGWVKMWGCPQLLAKPGKKYEMTPFVEVWFLGGGCCNYRQLGYPDGGKLDVVAWPADGDEAVRFELNAETWCGIRRTPDQPPRTDGLRKIAFSTKRAVTNGEPAIIPLWDCGKDAEIHEDEDLFFGTVQPYVVVSHKPDPDSATESQHVSAKEFVAKVVSTMLQLDGEFLQELQTGAAIRGVTAAGDVEMLHEMGQRLSEGGPLLLSDAQVRVLTAAVERRPAHFFTMSSQMIVFTGSRGFSRPVFHIADFFKPDPSAALLRSAATKKSEGILATW